MLFETRETLREMVKDQVLECHSHGIELYTHDDVFPHRRISLQGETAYRLCHHDFFGLSVQEAAEVMGIESRTVYAHLEKVKAAAPQLFPVLPQRSAKIYFLFTVENMTVFEISQTLHISMKTVSELLWRLYRDRQETGLFFRSGSRRRIKYESWMDPHIRQEF